jgi:hypothetical protein
MENNRTMDTEAFALQIAWHIQMLKMRFEDATQAYQGSKFQKHETAHLHELHDHFLTSAELVGEVQTKRESYKPHVVRKDECLQEVQSVIEALVDWQQSPATPFPLDQMLWAEQCLAIFYLERKIPHDTAVDAVQYHPKVVELIEAAYQENQVAIKRGDDTPWTDYKIRKAVAEFIADWPEEFNFEGELKDAANSSTVKLAVRNAIKDRGACFPRKPRNKGRGWHS